MKFNSTKNVAVLLVLSLFVFASKIQSSPNSVIVPLHDNGRSTLYVYGQFGDLDQTEMMVDTGSGYVTINEDTLSKLKMRGQTTYVKKIKGILANGSHYIVPVWSVKSLTINNECVINDVEAAVFPGKTRQILGLTALRKAAPFTISISPSNLTLDGCHEMLNNI